MCKSVSEYPFFFFFDGVLTLAYHENSEIVGLKLHFLSFTAKFVCFQCLNLSEIYGFFLDPEKGKRRECGYLAAM